jgi:hypothetical protein
LSRPPAASAASWKASTVARSSTLKATCVPLSGPRPRSAIQKNGKSRPNPPTFGTGSIISPIPSGASARP